MYFTCIYWTWRIFLLSFLTVNIFLGSSSSRLCALAQETKCQEGEALLQIEATTGLAPDYDWQIYDDMTGQLIHHCPPEDFVENTTSVNTSNSTNTPENTRCYWDSNQNYFDQICLPREGCYTLVVAKRYTLRNVSDTIVDVIFDGRLWASFDHLQYETTRLAIGSMPCETSLCDADSHLLELFLFREDVYEQGYPNMTWWLSTFASEEPDGDFGTDVISYGDRAFHYHRACIPRSNPCVKFDISVPPTYEVVLPVSDVDATVIEEQDYNEGITIRLVFDGRMDWDRMYQFGGNDEYNRTFDFSWFAGECSGLEVCGKELSLLQLDFVTGPGGPTWQVENFSISIATLFDDSSFISSQSHIYPFYPDKMYRYLICFQYEHPGLDGVCSEFAMDYIFDQNGNDAGYVISVEGVVFSERYPCVRDYCIGQLVTPLQDQCGVPSIGSGSASVGIVAVCGVVLTVLFTLMI